MLAYLQSVLDSISYLGRSFFRKIEHNFFLDRRCMNTDRNASLMVA